MIDYNTSMTKPKRDSEQTERAQAAQTAELAELREHMSRERAEREALQKIVVPPLTALTADRDKLRRSLEADYTLHAAAVDSRISELAARGADGMTADEMFSALRSMLELMKERDRQMFDLLKLLDERLKEIEGTLAPVLDDAMGGTHGSPRRENSRPAMPIYSAAGPLNGNALRTIERLLLPCSGDPWPTHDNCSSGDQPGHAASFPNSVVVASHWATMPHGVACNAGGPGPVDRLARASITP